MESPARNHSVNIYSETTSAPLGDPMKLKRCLAAAAVSAVMLTGCSQGEDPQPVQSPSADAGAESTATVSPSTTQSATPKVSSPPSKTPTATETPVANGAAPEAITGDDGRTTSLDEFLGSGGACFSDYFPAGPLTETAMTEVQNYCATQSPGSAQDNSAGQSADDRAQCEALDPTTATSGAIQYCYMEYGIHPAMPPSIEGDSYTGYSGDAADTPL